MPEKSEPASGLRADAQRNLEKLRAAAAEAFSERGLDAPLEEIAERAGVSIGTLYNRLGSRETLIDAVITDTAAAQVAAAVERAETITDPWGRFARYVEDWRMKVERIGNLNYPDEARRQQLHGQLVMTVAINRDGSIKSTDVIQSSGHKLLDDAAIRLVRLAAPFPPIPATHEKVDELYVTRTWQFLPGDVLRNK